MTKCDYEYGEEILVRNGTIENSIKRIFLFMLPNGYVCCLCDGYEVEHFNDGCVSDINVWKHHRKLEKPKEPEYEPYTFETFKADRDCWFESNEDGSLGKIVSYDHGSVFLVYEGDTVSFMNYTYFKSNYKKEDGTPAGTLKGGAE